MCYKDNWNGPHESKFKLAPKLEPPCFEDMQQIYHTIFNGIKHENF